MYDELTRSDIQKMQEEIDYRVRELRPKLIVPSRRKTGMIAASAICSG